MKIKALLVVTAGILIAAYPALQHAYTRHQQEALLQEWDRTVRNQDLTANDGYDSSCDVIPEEAIQSFTILEDTFSKNEDVQSEDDQNEAEFTNEAPIESPVKAKQPELNTLGVLYIDKIGLKLPILEGSTPNILKLGAGKLKGTSEIGKAGNTAISAHRSHKYGLNFNRLDEVEVGDAVKIETKNNIFMYEVFNTLVVEPDDISVLKKSKTESILTLITCHPLYTASHRLIVQARLLTEQ